MASFICTECGSSAEILFKEYSTSVLKLHNCEKCSNPVDKYIEYDETVICMDVVLQKVPAYRHILYNAGFKAFWKLGVLSVIFTGYVKCNIAQTETEARKKHQEFSFELDWNFYLACFQSAIEFAIYLISILSVTRAFGSVKSHNYRKLIDGLMLANFGQILAVPTVIWNEKMHHIYFYLTFLLVVLSNVQVYRAVSSEGKVKSWCIVFIGFSIKILTSRLIEQHLFKVF